MNAEDEFASKELALLRVERDAHHRLQRLKVAVNDSVVTESAEGLWSEAAAALRAHQAGKNGYECLRYAECASILTALAQLQGNRVARLSAAETWQRLAREAPRARSKIKARVPPLVARMALAEEAGRHRSPSREGWGCAAPSIRPPPPRLACVAITPPCAGGPAASPHTAVPRGSSGGSQDRRR